MRIFLILLFICSYAWNVANADVKDILKDLNDPNCDRIFVVSHRGDWRNAPENSLKAICNCIDMGVDMVEIDVRMTKDGQLVLMHDETVNRTTTGKGNVSDLTLDELKKLYLKNGAGHKTRHTVPTLEEALNIAKGKILVNIDKGYDYFAEVIKIIEKTDTKKQVLLKSDKNFDDIIGSHPDLFTDLLFMPVVNINSPVAADIISRYLDNTKIIAFELNFSSESPNLRSLFNDIRNRGSKIFVNSLWPELCAGHDDDIAVEENMPDQSWGWLINSGASLIQTDRPRQLIDYVKNFKARVTDIIYVDPDNLHEGNGTIESPFSSLDEAIKIASAGDAIYVAEGIFLQDSKTDEMIRITKDLNIIGGFNKSFTSATGITTLNSDKQAEHVIRIAPYVTVNLQNLSIKGGYATETTDNVGGGIYNEGSLYVTDCDISENYCKSSAGGAAIYSTGNLFIKNCNITDNTGYGDGGGVYINSPGFLSIEYSNFKNNSSKSGSAVFIKNASNCFISGSSFIGNKSETYGTLTFYNKNYTAGATIVNNTFVNNVLSGHMSGKSLAGGSAIYSYVYSGTSINLINNTISGNYCDACDAYGNVAPELGGAIMVRSGSLKLNNNIIIGNYSSSGFGDLYKNSTASITEKNNVFSFRDNINISSPSLKLSNISTSDAISIVPTILSGTIESDLFKADPVIGKTGTYLCPLLRSELNDITFNSLDLSSLKEKSIGTDIDNDNSLSGYLEFDQEMKMRNVSGQACLGAYEILSEGSVVREYISDSTDIYVSDSCVGTNSDYPEKIVIYTVDGVMIRHSYSDKGSPSISILDLPAGWYVVSAKSRNKNISKKFFIK